MNKRTYTKVLVRWVVVISMINGTMPFILSLFDKDPVSELGVVWVSSILCTVITYCAKSYFENKSKHRQELEEFKAGMDIDCEE